MRPGRLSMLLVLVVGLDPIGSGGEEPRPAAPVEQLEEWIRGLDSERYAVREESTWRLTQAGLAAVAPVFAAAQRGSPEVRRRAYSVLTELAAGAGEDPQAADAAARALERLAEGDDRRWSDVARAALQQVLAARHHQAASALARLGGTVNSAWDEVPFELPADQGHSQLTIGPQWSGGDGGVRHAAGLRNLGYVTLQDAPLSAAALEHLEPIKALRHISVYRGKITGKEWQAFRARRPDVVVFAIGEGFLGVNGEATPEGLAVQTVFAGSCADRAGIQVGDVIVALDGNRLSDVASLTLCVFDKKAGTPVVLEILRGKEKLTLRGELGARPDAVPSR